MHEGAILKSVFDIANNSRINANINDVQKVKLVVGKLHHIVFQVMQMYFNIMKFEIIGFDNAVLEIIEREPIIRCNRCGNTVILEEANFTCQVCNSHDTKLVQGDEMYIESLEGN